MTRAAARPEPPYDGDDRATLGGSLDFQRATKAEAGQRAPGRDAPHLRDGPTAGHADLLRELVDGVTGE